MEAVYVGQEFDRKLRPLLEEKQAIKKVVAIGGETMLPHSLRAKLNALEEKIRKLTIDWDQEAQRLGIQ